MINTLLSPFMARKCCHRVIHHVVEMHRLSHDFSCDTLTTSLACPYPPLPSYTSYILSLSSYYRCGEFLVLKDFEQEALVTRLGGDVGRERYCHGR